MDSWLRYFGSAVGFAFGAVWMTAGLGAAIVCVFLGALGYGTVFVADRARANASRRPQEETPEAELELERYYEPPDDATTPPAAETPLTAEAEYGWPLRQPEIVRAGSR